jgi:outer membrane protein assembly factor BamB
VTRTALRAAALLAAALPAAGAGGGNGGAAREWLLPNHDLASTRALGGSLINRGNVHRLHVAWRFRFRIPPRESGVFTSTPVVAGGVVYVQDMKSNVFALDLRTGRLRWRHLFSATNPGPNGLAFAGGRVYGATDSTVFALNAGTGRTVWRRFVVTHTARFVDVAPQVANGAVYTSTIGLPPNGRGVLYALDAATGAIRWRLSTIRDPWRIPSAAGGGGAWYPPSVDGDSVFWGTANPYPYGGTRAQPNGAAFAGLALYTDSLLVVDARTGALDWHDQVTAHDVCDYDFQLSPLLTTAGRRKLVVGAGKAGLVIAWDRVTHRRLWTTPVGTHRNDSGPLPRRPVSVCPGLLGGVETPMATAGGRVYVPVVDLCMRGGAYGFESLERVDVGARGKGRLVALDAATGRRLWTLRLPQPDFGCATVADGVVFTSTFDGRLYGVDAHTGAVLWKGSLRAGSNSCPALASDWLLEAAGLPRGRGSVLELTAFTTGGHDGGSGP